MNAKFRVWDTDNECYLKEGKQEGRLGFFWINLNSIGEVVTGYDDDVDEPASKGRFIVEFFTGLLDKNGREIYEGDRVKSPEYDGAVKFGPIEAFCGFSYNGEDEYNIEKEIIGFYVVNEPIGQYDELEVFGHIHDNPELLETKNDREKSHNP